MPTEDRRITFENEEVYKALYALCTQKQVRKPPPGHVSKIYEKESGGMIYLDLENPQNQTKASEGYTQDFLAAALMLYCRGCGIPLPKNAKKSVQISEGKIILRVQV